MKRRLIFALTATFAIGCASPRSAAQEVNERLVPANPAAREIEREDAPPISPAVSPGALTLDQCIELGMAHQPAIDAARASLNAALSGQRGLNKLIIPRLFTPDYKIRQQQACRGVSVAEAGLTQAEWETRYSVTRNFYTVQYINAQKIVIDDVLNSLETGYKRAETLYKSGEATVKINKVDLETIQINLGLVRAKKAQVDNGMEKAKAALREAMGLGHDYPLDILAVGLPAAYDVSTVKAKDGMTDVNVYTQRYVLNKDELIRSAQAMRAEMAQANNASEITALEISAQNRIRGWKGITFATGSDIHAKQIPQGIFNNEYRPGAIGIEMPPMLVGRMRDREQRASDYHQRARAVVEKTTNLIALDVEAQFLKWQEAAAEIKEFMEILPIAQALPAKAQKLNPNEFTSSSLIQANTTAVMVRTQLNDALHMHTLALVGLERATAGAFRLNATPIVATNNAIIGPEIVVPGSCFRSFFFPRPPPAKGCPSMTPRKMLALALLLAPLATSAHPQPSTEGPIKVGMVKAFFNDLPPAFIDVATGPFGDLMKTTTGFEGKLSTDDQYLDVAQKLQDGKLQLGVFHGHEFAWVQKAFPKLTPLMIATNKQHDVSAYVIVHKDSPAKSIADLRGKKFDVPFGTREHCRCFLRHHCKDNAQNDFNAFFSAVVNSSSSIDGLDEVCRKKVDAILVDTIALAFYKSIKGPVFDKNLRVLTEHKHFPSPVIVYCKGNVPEATIAKISDGMTQAHKNAKCKEMLDLWQIDAFETLPANYAEQLAVTLKAFPTPEPTKVSLR